MRYLLITNAYPNKERIYSNAFIHTRVKVYQEKGLNIEVVVMTTKVLLDEVYEGVTIKYMDEYQLADYINHQKFNKLLIHFMNLKMFKAIKMVNNLPEMVIWLHGFEAEPWYSRYYNYLVSKETLQKQIDRIGYYEEVKQMFLDLYDDNKYKVTFIFVSERYKKLYVDPYLRQTPKNFKVIHNIIDEMRFPYVTKTADMRFKICSIRPYTQPNYANDITRDVILALSKKKYFNQLTFNLYGDGPLFNEITKPLEKFKNVKLHQMFVPHEEIPNIHRAHGIYLGPTRHDSQGVSLNEAMSSGLVPISNDIGAIREFIRDGYTGMLAPRDDIQAMVKAIDTLVKNPERYLKMSNNASVEIQKQTGKDIIINQELEVILNGTN